MSVVVRLARFEDADAIAAVHVASWEDAYREILPPEYFEKRTIDVRKTQWRSSLRQENRVTLVACNERGEVVGFASALRLDGSDGGFESYLQTLYLVQSAKGRGTGRLLLRAMAAQLSSLGRRNMALRVLRLNRARSFYEKLGARLVPEGIAHDAGMFDDVVYAFDDLRALSGD